MSEGEVNDQGAPDVPKQTTDDAGTMAGKRRSTASGDETRSRIVNATLTTLKKEGIVGTSARAIAREGDFNQALIFYHFGSIEDLVVVSVAEMSRRRLDKHKDRLEQVESLSELIEIARQMHQDDAASDNMTVLTQAFAGASGNPELGPKLYTELEPWSDMVSEAIKRCVRGMPGAEFVPHEQMAQAISALFLGIELLNDLDPERADVNAIFDALESLARMFENLMQTALLQAFADSAAHTHTSTLERGG